MGLDDALHMTKGDWAEAPKEVEHCYSFAALRQQRAEVRLHRVRDAHHLCRAISHFVGGRVVVEQSDAGRVTTALGDGAWRLAVLRRHRGVRALAEQELDGARFSLVARLVQRRPAPGWLRVDIGDVLLDELSHLVKVVLLRKVEELMLLGDGGGHFAISFGQNRPL